MTPLWWDFLGINRGWWYRGWAGLDWTELGWVDIYDYLPLSLPLPLLLLLLLLLPLFVLVMCCTTLQEDNFLYPENDSSVYFEELFCWVLLCTILSEFDLILNIYWVLGTWYSTWCSIRSQVSDLRTTSDHQWFAVCCLLFWDIPQMSALPIRIRISCSLNWWPENRAI